MEALRLGPRLEAVASFVPPDACAADIGTDHGLLPVWLRLNGRAKRVIASDIRPGPLSAAQRNAERYLADGISFRLCAGLSGVSPEEVDTVVIAGMGGETMISILQEADWDWSGKRLILEANTRYPELLTWIYAHGLHVCGEKLAEERGRLYRICCIVSGQRELPGKAFLWGGAEDSAYARRQSQLLAAAAAGLRKSTSQKDRARLQEYISVLEEMDHAYHWGNTAGALLSGASGKENGL